MAGAAIPLAAVGAGGFLENRALNDAQREKQRRLQAALALDTSMANKQRGLLTDNASSTYDPAKRETALSGAESKIATDLSSYLQKNSTPSSSPTTSASPSPEFLKSSADSALTEGKRTALLTSLYSKLMAPGQMRFNEGLNNANVASNVDTIGANRLNQMRARMYGVNAVRPNSMQMLMGRLLMMGGAAGAGGPGAALAADAGNTYFIGPRGYQPQME